MPHFVGHKGGGDGLKQWEWGSGMSVKPIAVRVYRGALSYLWQMMHVGLSDNRDVTKIIH